MAKKVPRHELQRRVAATVPRFKFQKLTNTKGHVAVKVTCTRCGNWFIVKLRPWMNISDQPTRPCPFCFKVSRLHSETKESLTYE